MTLDPYVLAFRPLLLEKVWGGRKLDVLNKPLPPDIPIGESWEIADLASTSPSGGGGGAARSIIANGPLAGHPLADAISTWGERLIGRAAAAFPLLVKYLDARENLSVQVHPSPAFARTHADAHLKAESWYIIDADPGSVIYAGLRPGVTIDQLGTAARSGDVAPLLRALPAIPGQCHTLPSGTVHALGAGVLVAEVQTPSDTTYRLFDWGRTGRELHIDRALQCALEASPPAPTSLSPGQSRATLASTEHYRIDEARLVGGGSAPLSCRGFAVVMVLKGSGTVVTPSSSTRAPLGATLLVPACLADQARLHSEEDSTVLIASA